jgi:hypothetical protein
LLGVIDINNAGTILFERTDVDIPFQSTSFFTSSGGTLTSFGRVRRSPETVIQGICYQRQWLYSLQEYRDFNRYYYFRKCRRY